MAFSMDAAKKKGAFAVSVYHRRWLFLLCLSAVFLLYTIACSGSARGVAGNPLAYTQSWAAPNITSASQLLRFLFSRDRVEERATAQDGGCTRTTGFKDRSSSAFQRARQNRPTRGSVSACGGDGKVVLTQGTGPAVAAGRVARGKSVSRHGNDTRGDRSAVETRGSDKTHDAFSAGGPVSKSEAVNRDEFGVAIDTSYTGRNRGSPEASANNGSAYFSHNIRPVGRNSSFSEENFSKRIASSGNSTGQKGNVSSWSMSEFSNGSSARTNVPADFIGKLGGDTVDANTNTDVKNLQPREDNEVHSGNRHTAFSGKSFNDGKVTLGTNNMCGEW